MNFADSGLSKLGNAIDNFGTPQLAGANGIVISGAVPAEVSVSSSVSAGALGVRAGAVAGGTMAAGGVVYASKNSGQSSGGPSNSNVSTVKNNTLKTPPNPNGKKGGVAHQNKIKEIATDIEERGFTPEYEYKYDTSGGFKDTRYADVVGLDSQGRVAEIHQVGRSTKKYGAPISRERKAIRDIRLSSNYNGARIKYHPYDK